MCFVDGLPVVAGATRAGLVSCIAIQATSQGRHRLKPKQRQSNPTDREK